MEKRGQIEMSFQMIFSLILIAAFLYAAFVGIQYFIGTTDLTSINSFISDLQSKVDGAYMLTEMSETYSFSLPTRIQSVCFADSALTKAQLSAECGDFELYITAFKSSGMNMFFCPASGALKVGAPIDVKILCKGKDCLSFPKTPYCIKNTGKFSISLEKNYGEQKIKLS